MKSRLAFAALLAACFAFGAAGTGWDLPSASRAERLLAPGWDKTALFDRLAGGWEDIYSKAAGSTPLAAEREGKYSANLKGSFSTDFKTPLPAPELWNSYRSMLIRSRYPDEALPLSDLARMNPGKLDFRPPSFLYGGGYLYPLGAYYFALSKIKIVKPMQLRKTLEETGSLGRIYLAGRLLSAASFAGICLLVFLIAARLQPGLTAYAALAAALSIPVFGIYARYLTPHLWATFWGLAAVYFSLRALPDLKLGPLLAAGACLGLGTGSYWATAHTAIFLLAAVMSPGREALRPAALKRIGLGVLVCAAVFLAVNPYVPFNWTEVMHELGYAGGASGNTPGIKLGLLFADVLPSAASPVLAFLFPAGCLWGIFSGRPLLRNLSIAALLLALPISTTLSADFPAGIRRFFPWLFIGTTIGIVFLGRLTAKLKPYFRAGIFAAALIPGLVLSAAYALSFIDASGPRSTFYRMADKLDSMPPGATLGMVKFPQPAYMPAFRLDRWRLRLADSETMQGLPAKRLPEFMLVNGSRKKSIAGLLKDKYTLYQGFYPRKLLGFTPDPVLCEANPPLELFRLNQEESR